MRKSQFLGKNSHSAAATRSRFGKSSESSEKTAMMLGSSPTQLAQNKLIDSIQTSPYAVAQREKMESISQPSDSKMVQRASGEEELQAKADPAQLQEEEELQGKFVTAQMQGHEEEEPVQGKMATTQLEEGQTAAGGNETGLPDNLKTGIESMSGMSMDSVRVHYNSDKPAQLNALAYAQGSNIHVSPGQEKHVPHEAWHVVQQAQGRVSPTKEMAGGTQVNDDKGLETEADVMGAKAAQFKPASDSRMSH
tara:strand:- start:6847 stop:7599 length:753 start_codon:yes stop_codon:yes gene_type:complete